MMVVQFENQSDETFLKRLCDESIPLDDQQTALMYGALPTGCRTKEGFSWYEGWKMVDGGRLPAIMRCEFTGNWLNPANYQLVAVFDSSDEMLQTLSRFRNYEREIIAPRLVGTK